MSEIKFQGIESLLRMDKYDFAWNWLVFPRILVYFKAKEHRTFHDGIA